MKDILSEIIANKRFEVDLQKQAISIEQLQEGISEVPTSRSMKQALASSASGIIAEFKRRSPSKGWIKEEACPEEACQEKPCLPDPHLLDFFEAMDDKKYDKMLEALAKLSEKATQKEIDDICMVLDITPVGESVFEQLAGIRRHVLMLKKFDGERLR